MGDVVCYLSTRKNRHHGDAIARGFGARCVPVERAKIDEGAALHLVGGLQFGALEVLKELRERRLPHVFFDRAYFGGGPGTDRLRVVPGAYQKSWITVMPDDRLRRFGVRLEPWRAAGRHILVVPPGDAVAALFGLQDWLAGVLARLDVCTDRPVVVSRKGDPKPLEERLAGCHTVVTWTSNVAVDAIVAGVPAIVHSESAAWPCAGSLVDLERDLDAPRRGPRELWAASLAYGQFTVEEIASGAAAGTIFPRGWRDAVAG